MLFLKKQKRLQLIWSQAIQRQVDTISLLQVTQFTENWNVSLHFVLQSVGNF